MSRRTTAAFATCFILVGTPLAAQEAPAPASLQQVKTSLQQDQSCRTRRAGANDAMKALEDKPFVSEADRQKETGEVLRRLDAEEACVKTAQEELGKSLAALEIECTNLVRAGEASAQKDESPASQLTWNRRCVQWARSQRLSRRDLSTEMAQQEVCDVRRQRLRGAASAYRERSDKALGSGGDASATRYRSNTRNANMFEAEEKRVGSKCAQWSPARVVALEKTLDESTRAFMTMRMPKPGEVVPDEFGTAVRGLLAELQRAAAGLATPGDPAEVTRLVGTVRAAGAEFRRRFPPGVFKSADEPTMKTFQAYDALMRGFEAWRDEQAAATKMTMAPSQAERDQVKADRDRLATTRTTHWTAMATLIREAEAGLSVAKQ